MSTTVTPNITLGDHEADDAPAVEPEPTRIDDLKQQLTAEYEQLLESAEARLEVIDNQIGALTEKRRQTADELKAHRRDLERLTGTRTHTTTPATGTFECKHPDCDRTFASSQGAATHYTRTHKKTATAAKRTPPRRGRRRRGRCTAAARSTRSTTAASAATRSAASPTSPTTPSRTTAASRPRPRRSSSPRTADA